MNKFFCYDILHKCREYEILILRKTKIILINFYLNSNLKMTLIYNSHPLFYIKQKFSFFLGALKISTQSPKILNNIENSNLVAT